MDRRRGRPAYLVLDEFHTYDGAQGTDVAMLLRRLAAVARPRRAGRPLGDVTPVATSATLGDGDAARRRAPGLRRPGLRRGLRRRRADRRGPADRRRVARRSDRDLGPAAERRLCRWSTRPSTTGRPSHLAVAEATWALLTGTTEDWFARRAATPALGHVVDLPEPGILGKRCAPTRSSTRCSPHARTPISLADLVARRCRPGRRRSSGPSDGACSVGLLALIALAEDPTAPAARLSIEVQVWIREVAPPAAPRRRQRPRPRVPLGRATAPGTPSTCTCRRSTAGTADAPAGPPPTHRRVGR